MSEENRYELSKDVKSDLRASNFKDWRGVALDLENMTKGQLCFMVGIPIRMDSEDEIKEHRNQLSKALGG